MGFKDKKRLLWDFPELWAFSRDWNPGPEVRVCRASDIGLLTQPLRPDTGMDEVTVHIATRFSTVEQLGESFCGESIVESKTRAADLQMCLCVNVGMRGKSIHYFFLVETRKNDLGRVGRIVVVKPPVGKRNFEGYLKESGALVRIRLAA